MEKVIIGAGGFAREIQAEYKKHYGQKLKLFVDDIYYKKEDGVFRMKDLNFKTQAVIIAVGEPASKEIILKNLPKNTSFWGYVSPNADIIDRETIKIGWGSIVCSGCILTTNITIGNHVHLNLNTTIGHDTTIDDFSTTAPNVNISGNVNIGKRVYLGTNAVVREKLEIHSDIIIGLNSGVVNELKDSDIYIGTPAKKLIKNNKE
jgi:sugar O-acyltransferase (sialic acid O-acetyltransferase NeuD family)